MSSAAFKLRNITTAGAWSPFSDRGFTAAPGDVIEAQLEDVPAGDIWITTFANPQRSDGRTAPTFSPGTGIAATPTAAVQFTMPAERGIWSIRCMTNDGAAVLVNNVSTSAPNIKYRFVCIPTLNFDLRHMLAGETDEDEENGWPVKWQELVDTVDAMAGAAADLDTAKVWVDAATVPASWTGAVPTRAIVSTLNVIGASAVVPMTLGYYRSAGAFGAVLKLRRVILGGSGAPDTSTGADVEWTIPNDDATPAEVTQVRIRPVLTTIAGANLTSDLGFWLVNGGTLTQTFTLKANGAVVVSGKISGLTAGAATGEAVEYDQLNTALGGYVPVARTVTAGLGLTGGGALSGNITLDVVAADGTITVGANAIEATGDFGAKTITNTGRAEIPRHVAAPVVALYSAGSLVFALGSGQNQRHLSTDSTTVSFTGAVEGQDGTIDIIQGGSGKTFTFPADGSGVEYEASLKTLAGINTLVDTGANTRTVLSYYVTGYPNVRVFIKNRAVSILP